MNIASVSFHWKTLAHLLGQDCCLGLRVLQVANSGPEGRGPCRRFANRGTPRDLEQEEGVDMATDEAAPKVIREQLQYREKDEGQQLLFLQAIYPACLAAREREEDTLEPRCCKAAVVKRIVHVSFWIVSRMSQERARAIRSSTALLRYTVTLPEFDISAKFPRMGHHVAQLALFVSDPDKDISRQAREGTYRLYQLMLQQRAKEPSWDTEPNRGLRLTTDG
ncbi:unnamed protein product [Caretta caretta]